MFKNSRSNGAGQRNSTHSESRSKFHYIGSPLSARMIFILLHYLLSFVTVTSSAHQHFLCCVISSSAAISVPHSVRARRYYGPPGGGGGPSLGDRPPGGGGGPSSLGWGRTKGGGGTLPEDGSPCPAHTHRQVGISRSLARAGWGLGTVSLAGFETGQSSPVISCRDRCRSRKLRPPEGAETPPPPPKCFICDTVLLRLSWRSRGRHGTLCAPAQAPCTEPECAKQGHKKCACNPIHRLHLSDPP